MTEGSSWFKQEWRDVDEGQAAQDKMFAGKGTGTRRFWIPENKAVRVLFVDELPFQIWEHNWKANGNWRNWATCLVKNGIGKSCPACDMSGDRDSTMKLYYVGYFTVMELGEWVDKKGEVHKFSRRLFPAKTGSKKRPGVMVDLKRLHEKHGGLQGIVAEIMRKGSQSPSVGDVFDFEKKVNMKDGKEFRAFLDLIGFTPEDWKKNPVKPLDYKTLLAPMSEQDFRNALKQGSSSFDGGGESPPAGQFGGESSSPESDSPY